MTHHAVQEIPRHPEQQRLVAEALPYKIGLTFGSTLLLNGLWHPLSFPRSDTA